MNFDAAWFAVKRIHISTIPKKNQCLRLSAEPVRFRARRPLAALEHAGALVARKRACGYAPKAARKIRGKGAAAIPASRLLPEHSRPAALRCGYGSRNGAAAVTE